MVMVLKIVSINFCIAYCKKACLSNDKQAEILFMLSIYSSIEIASTGQTSAQEPQSVQSSGSIT
jgi:hypothetical protein